jgi:Rieske Fe-S protein
LSSDDAPGRIEEENMATCEVCGNDYDKSFEVVAADIPHTFDSFECAIHLMAPICEHCGCRVIGHGTEVEGRFYCCAHCARQAEEADTIKDRV